VERVRRSLSVFDRLAKTSLKLLAFRRYMHAATNERAAFEHDGIFYQ
jgi:hypothetical protein